MLSLGGPAIRESFWKARITLVIVSIVLFNLTTAFYPSKHLQIPILNAHTLNMHNEEFREDSKYK